ncbi:hypothetical protein HUJ04_003986 [Dendroctonus ponderosae]|nr:hypothetical protein HUJ04_003986 [Dendroctonus ponderosae]
MSRGAVSGARLTACVVTPHCYRHFSSVLPLQSNDANFESPCSVKKAPYEHNHQPSHQQARLLPTCGEIWIQAVRTLIEKCTEHNVPLHLPIIDYQKDFDSVDIWAILHSTAAGKIDSRGIPSEICMNTSLSTLKPGENVVTERTPIKRGVRQGDATSRKLLILVLQGVFTNLTWQKKGINIHGRFLTHLRPKYVHFGHNIKLGRHNQTAEITRRIGLMWAPFGKRYHIPEKLGEVRGDNMEG